MKYPLMTIEEFGRELIASEDLDPIYTMLHRSSLSWEQKSRWCLAYWCFYHAGVCSYIVEQPEQKFWGLMMDAAINDRSRKTWPRGTERRHFRASAAINSVRYMTDNFRSASAVVDYFGSGILDLVGVANRVTSIPAFGPWIAFKVADMMERCLNFQVKFYVGHLYFYKTPIQGAELACEKWTSAHLPPREALGYAVSRLQREFKDFMAPPSYNRPVGIQEIETVLCKWKSHMGGHYEPGKDTKEIRHGLDGWGDLAQEMKGYLP